jgi:hypothetical protein
MVIATLMNVLIHGPVIDSLIDAGLGTPISKGTTPKISSRQTGYTVARRLKPVRNTQGHRVQTIHITG